MRDGLIFYMGIHLLIKNDEIAPQGSHDKIFKSGRQVINRIYNLLVYTAEQIETSHEASIFLY